ncbi:hypothetical protein E4U54_006609 [Claviceps lovelessii]|nr:hypothetical protein E4U54_006609 [Claviceps lovelessii]
MSFSLQSYLNHENELERCMAGAKWGQIFSPPGDTAPAAAQPDKRDYRSTATTAPESITAASTGPEWWWLQMDDLDGPVLPDLSVSAANDGTDPYIHDAMSFGSWSSRSSAPSAVSPTSSSGRASPQPNDGLVRLPVFARHAALHRQLQEAGLLGLGDGSRSLELYHR